MHDRVITAELIRAHVANISGDARNQAFGCSEVASGVEEGVQTQDVVSRGGEHRARDRAEVAVMAGYEDPHAHTFQGTSPLSHIALSARTSRSVSMHCQNPSCR